MSELPFQFHIYGLLVGLGGVAVISWSEYLYKKEKIPLNFNTLSLVVIVSSLIGARVYHLLTDWQLYQDASITQMIAVWNGGIGIIGALVGGLIGIVSYLLFQKKSGYFSHVLDILALSLPFGQAIGRWGNYFNQELYGRVTNLPWGISIQNEPAYLKFHPLFFYESLLLFTLGLLLNYTYKIKRLQIGKGSYTALYLIYYGTVRFLLEFLRIDSSRSQNFLSIFTVAQWMMVLSVIIGMLLVYRSFLKKSSL